MGNVNTLRKTKVLVMDDDRAVADSFVLILRFYGYDASCVYSGEQAIEVIRTNPCDVLISDVVVDGGMSGIELAIEFSQLLPLCKVLLMSGTNSTSNLLKDANECGYKFDVLAKPVHPSVVLEHLGSLAA